MPTIQEIKAQKNEERKAQNSRVQQLLAQHSQGKIKKHETKPIKKEEQEVLEEPNFLVHASFVQWFKSFIDSWIQVWPCNFVVNEMAERFYEGVLGYQVRRKSFNTNQLQELVKKYKINEKWSEEDKVAELIATLPYASNEIYDVEELNTPVKELKDNAKMFIKKFHDECSDYYHLVARGQMEKLLDVSDNIDILRRMELNAMWEELKEDNDVDTMQNFVMYLQHMCFYSCLSCSFSEGLENDMITQALELTTDNIDVDDKGDPTQEVIDQKKKQMFERATKIFEKKQEDGESITNFAFDLGAIVSDIISLNNAISKYKKSSNELLKSEKISSSVVSSILEKLPCENGKLDLSKMKSSDSIQKLGKSLGLDINSADIDKFVGKMENFGIDDDDENE